MRSCWRWRCDRARTTPRWTRWPRALAPSAERLAETVEQGAAFARTVAALTGRDLPPRALPVAVGQAARGLELAADTGDGAVPAGLRRQSGVGRRPLRALGQTEGQAVLAALHPVIRALGRRGGGGRRWTTSAARAFGADLAAMRHETLDVRIFRT